MTSIVMRARVAADDAFRRLQEKGRRYWIAVIVILAVTVTGTPFIYGYLNLTGTRAALFEKLATLSPRPLAPRFVKVVLIGDDDYWGGKAGGRRPIDRNLLASIVAALDSAQLIALDFDLRLPQPGDDTVPEVYRAESKNLIEKIVAAATAGKKIVLARAIWTDAQGGYVFNADLYEAYGLCKALDSDSHWLNPGGEIVVNDTARKNISCGYIALPYDEIGIPGRLPMADGKYLDSFAVAIAKARNYDSVADFAATLSYGSYIPEATMLDKHVVLSSHELLTQKDKADEMAGQAVIVGAHWRSLAVARGDWIDIHETPVGAMIGALVHANFVEALLDSRTYPKTSIWVVRGAEIAFAIAAAVIFALLAQLWRKLAALAALSFLLVLMQWSALHLFGIFFDDFVPLLALWLHSVFEFYERSFE